MKPKLHICLPILNESANLPKLIHNLKAQKFTNFSLYACVNQPDEWWNDAEQKIFCLDNKRSLEILAQNNDFDIFIIDKSTKGNGWNGKKKGVGWARKLVMDMAANRGRDHDIIVSIDADTDYTPTYLQSLVNVFIHNSKITAHSNPYYHPLSGKKSEDSAILRYELYMRVYAIQMLLIDNPYAFSAIGSGMATTVFQYKRMGGISPKQSGEDFYFIQKMCKSGKLSNYNTEKVYPQARFSNRVNFGTGPAMIKGNNGDWSSYPFYSTQLFLQVQETFQTFGDLFYEDINTPMTSFLIKQLKRNDIWGPLRKNFKKKDLFIKACIELVDGLRILQFMKDAHKESNDEFDFMDSIQHIANANDDLRTYLKEIGFSGSPLSFENMKAFRDILTNIEYKFRKTKAIH